jgi:hypothetical protein
MPREQSFYTRFRRERSEGVDIQYHVERGDYSITTFEMSFALRERGVRQRRKRDLCRIGNIQHIFSGVASFAVTK